jgi:hypothetical protein
MRKRSPASAWRVALAVLALIATALALYVLLSERRSSPEEGALAASAPTETPAPVQAEEKAAEPPGDGPLPNAVLRRSESGGSALQQVRDSQDAQEAALVRLQERLDALALQIDRSDRALRRDLAEIREEVRRERAASRKVLGLLLAALVPLVVHLLASLRPAGGDEEPS